MIAAIYDRDYYSPEEITAVTDRLSEHLQFAQILQRKEIENYLLIPAAIDRALTRAAADRTTRTGQLLPSLPKAATLLQKISDGFRDDVQSQLIGRRTTYLRQSGMDNAQITRETIKSFSPKWEDMESRMEIVPGKEVLTKFRDEIQRTHGLSITDARIVEAMHKDEIPDDLISLLEKLDLYRKTHV